MSVDCSRIIQHSIGTLEMQDLIVMPLIKQIKQMINPIPLKRNRANKDASLPRLLPVIKFSISALDILLQK